MSARATATTSRASAATSRATAATSRATAATSRASALTAVLCAALLACACAGTPAKGEGDHVVSFAELPERHRAVWSAYKAGGAGWVIERERTLDDPELANFLVDNLVSEMVRAYDRSRLAATGRADGPFERARDELVAFQVYSMPVLVELVRVGDGVVAFLARDLLCAIGPASVGAAQGLLDDPDEHVRARAAELFVELPGPAEPAVEDALRGRLAELLAADPSWVARALAARALGRRGSFAADKRPTRSALVPALRDADPAVAETAAAALGELGDARAVPDLIEAYARAAAAGDLPTLRAALAGLRSLTGADFRSPEEWRRYWEQNRRALLERGTDR